MLRVAVRLLVVLVLVLVLVLVVQARPGGACRQVCRCGQAHASFLVAVVGHT